MGRGIVRRPIGPTACEERDRKVAIWTVRCKSRGRVPASASPNGARRAAHCQNAGTHGRVAGCIRAGRGRGSMYGGAAGAATIGKK